MRWLSPNNSWTGLAENHPIFCSSHGTYICAICVSSKYRLPCVLPGGVSRVDRTWMVQQDAPPHIFSCPIKVLECRISPLLDTTAVAQFHPCCPPIGLATKLLSLPYQEWIYAEAIGTEASSFFAFPFSIHHTPRHSLAHIVLHSSLSLSHANNTASLSFHAGHILGCSMAVRGTLEDRTMVDRLEPCMGNVICSTVGSFLTTCMN